MTDKCLALKELKSVRSLPVSDPRRKHFEDCPRCRSRLISYRDFIEPVVPISGSKPKEAAAHLADFVDRELLGRSSEETEPMVDGGREPEDLGTRLFQWLWRPVLRPVWAVGILILAVVGIQEVRRTGPDQGDRIILRQSPEMPVEAFGIRDPELLEDGALRLSWEPVSGADAYQVSILGVELEELRRVDSGPNASLLISEQLLEELRSFEGPLLWEVIALTGGDQVATSGIYPLPSLQ